MRADTNRNSKRVRDVTGWARFCYRICQVNDKCYSDAEESEEERVVRGWVMRGSDGGKGRKGGREDE